MCIPPTKKNYTPYAGVPLGLVVSINPLIVNRSHLQLPLSEGGLCGLWWAGVNFSASSRLPVVHQKRDEESNKGRKCHAFRRGGRHQGHLIRILICCSVSLRHHLYPGGELTGILVLEYKRVLHLADANSRKRNRV